MKTTDAPDRRSGCGFDRIVFAVGSDDQKRILQNLLSSALRRCGAEVRIVPDGENGRRLGSGGAVLRILRELAAEGGLTGSKTLLINCGGEGRRTANFSFCSKALIPAGIDGNGDSVTCFSHILQNASLLSGRMAPGVLLCCIDIPLDMSAFTGTLLADTSFCVEAPVAAGSRHGVMVADPNGLLSAYYQKAPEETLLACAADSRGNVALEAGWTYFSADTAAALAAAAADYTARNGALPFSNLYEDVMPLFAPQTDRAFHLRTDTTGLRRFLASRLPAGAMRVCTLRQPFLHFGTLFEILRNNTAAAPEKRQIFSSTVGVQVSVGEETLLDHARIGGLACVGSRCLISDIDLWDVAVPDGTAVFGLRLKDGRFVSVVSGIGSDPRDAARTADTLWDTALFYPAESFTESYALYTRPPHGAAVMSLPECLSKADPISFIEWRHYLEDLLESGQTSDPRYAAWRDRLLASYYDGRAPMKRLACVKNAAEIRLPVRVNFSGTWTDCMPYCIENGGAVVNAAVTVDGAYPISISARQIPEKRIEFCNGENPTRIAVYDPLSAVADYTEFGLHHAVFQAMGVDGRTEIADGLRLTVQVAGLAMGSGLGISSILLYGCFAVLADLFGLTFSEAELLTKAFIAEQLMRTGGGWQDQGGVIGSGIKVVSSPAGLPQRISVTPAETAPGFLRRLSDRMVLIPTGRRHFGRFIVADVMNRYLSGENRAALREIETLNRPLLQSVGAGDLSLFAETVNAHSECLTRLSPLIYSEALLSLRQEVMRYADACCICGAGGGGYLWALRKENVSQKTISHALQTKITLVEIC